MLLEVIVQTVADAREAERGGADRLEVVRAIRDGGLTPLVSLVRSIAAETRLPLRVMVRENAGYAMRAAELPALRRAAADFSTAGVDGLVIGFARGGKPALDDLTSVLEAAPDIPVTFHRAFDVLADPLAAIDELTSIPQVDRILTSGGDASPASRCERLRAYVARARGRVEIIAGSGVDAGTMAFFARTKCVREVHVGRAARLGGDANAPVSAPLVRRLRELSS
jgi:copper homeostasis protein